MNILSEIITWIFGKDPYNELDEKPISFQLSVITPYSEKEIFPLVYRTIKHYKHQNIIDDFNKKVKDTVLLALNRATAKNTHPLDELLNILYKEINDGANQICTREFCAICGNVVRVGFLVPDNIWKEVVHPSRINDIHCLECFTKRADEKLIEWSDDMKFYPVSLKNHLDDEWRPNLIGGKNMKS